MTDLDHAFRALSDPTRRAILRRLKQGEASAGELAEPFDISQPAISRHLKTLRDAGLVTHRRDGTRRLFRIAPERLQDLDRFLSTLMDRPGPPPALDGKAGGSGTAALAGGAAGASPAFRTDGAGPDGRENPG